MRHVGVQHAGLAGDAVDRAVDEHGGGFHRMAAGQHRAVGIDHHDVVGLHLVPQQAPRVQQKAARAVGQFDAEVGAHALGQAMVGSGAQGQRQVGTQLGDLGAVKVVEVHLKVMGDHGRFRGRD